MRLSNFPPRYFSRPVEINGIKRETKFITVSIKDNINISIVRSIFLIYLNIKFFWSRYDKWFFRFWSKR